MCDSWILDNVHFKIYKYGISVQHLKDTDLIVEIRTWTREVIETTFSEADACNFLQIALVIEGHEDFMV